MVIDWGLAGKIGGLGFGTVFAVLIILAVAIWITALVTRKIGTSKEETTNKQEQKGA
ncbi:OadG family protein [Chloroflexota bacterium]